MQVGFSRAQRLVPSIVTQPPIFTHASVPGILTNPAPKAPHDSSRAVARDFLLGGGDALAGALGWVNVCAEAHGAMTAAATATAAISAMRRSISRVRTLRPFMQSRLSLATLHYAWSLHRDENERALFTVS